MDKFSGIPRELTVQEELELDQLKKKIFSGQMFVEVSDNNSESEERYNYLIKLKQLRLSYEEISDVLYVPLNFN